MGVLIRRSSRRLGVLLRLSLCLLVAFEEVNNSDIISFWFPCRRCRTTGDTTTTTVWVHASSSSASSFPRTVDSEALFLGDWQVHLHERRRRQGRRQGSGDDNTHDVPLFPVRDLQLQHKEKSEQREKRQQRGAPRVTPCRLQVFSNGTFALQPQAERKIANRQSDSDVLPIRGVWKIRRNPYCVTDRYYDEITLISYPRVQKKISNTYDKKNDSNNNLINILKRKIQWDRFDKTINNKDVVVLQRLQFAGSGRLSGHFTSLASKRNNNRRSKRVSFVRGRIGRGVILISSPSSSSSFGSQEISSGRSSGRVLATFSGRKIRHLDESS